jgi:hypothetical protein
MNEITQTPLKRRTNMLRLIDKAHTEFHALTINAMREAEAERFKQKACAEYRKLALQQVAHIGKLLDEAMK